MSGASEDAITKLEAEHTPESGLHLSTFQSWYCTGNWPSDLEFARDYTVRY